MSRPRSPDSPVCQLADLCCQYRYSLGCRCDACRKAHAELMKRVYAKKKLNPAKMTSERERINEMRRRRKLDPAYKAMVNGQSEIMRQQFVDYVRKHKMSVGCTDCGYKSHAEALEFDHVRGTKKSISMARLCSNKNMSALLAEIAKCEVVCANCHRVRTHTRRLAKKNIQGAAELNGR